MLIDQPVVRPAVYPEEVLWNHEDIKRCPGVKLSTHNQSRPPAQQCLRTPTGTIISDTQWKDIKRSVSIIIRDVLAPLTERSPLNAPYRKNYFQKNWPREWEEALAKIEDRQPILKLCSFHWKSELVLTHGLDLSKLGRKAKSGCTALPPSPPETTASLQAAASPQPLETAGPSQPRPTTPPRTPQTSAPSQPQLPTPSRPERAASSQPRTAASAPQNAAAPSPLKFSKHKMDPNSPVAPVKKKRTSRFIFFNCACTF